MATMAALLQLAYEPLLSVAHVSTACAAVTAVDFASASLPLLRWFRNEGMAIAARMPMIRMTTRSSIRVKPFSLLGTLAELPQHLVIPPYWGAWSASLFPGGLGSQVPLSAPEEERLASGRFLDAQVHLP